jgi:hypothetical protein
MGGEAWCARHPHLLTSSVPRSRQGVHSTAVAILVKALALKARGPWIDSRQSRLHTPELKGSAPNGDRTQTQRTRISGSHVSD